MTTAVEWVVGDIFSSLLPEVGRDGLVDREGSYASF